MQILYGDEEIPLQLQGGVVTVGNFDGIHLGHRHILNDLVDKTRQEGRKAILITFDPHPKMLIHPDIRPFYLITTLEEKLELVRQCGLDGVIVIRFTLDYARTTAREFIEGFLWEKMRIARIVIGHDYTFGRGKEGNEELLVNSGHKLGFAVDAINAFNVDGKVISSTRIRQTILRGEMEIAASLLGRHYSLTGRVIPGHGRGAALGFPTANMQPEKELIPPDGVYAVLCCLDGKKKGGVMNIGGNPTFGNSGRSLEVHLLDFNGNIYGRRMEIQFLARIREEFIFPGTDQLIKQIGRDVDAAREIIDGLSISRR